MESNQETYSLRGRTFRTKTDYARAWHDNRVITQIEASLNKSDITQVSNLRRSLENNKIKFESILGQDFLDEIVSLEQKLLTEDTEVEAIDKRATIKKNKLKDKASKSDSNTKLKTKKPKAEKARALDDYDPDMKHEILRELKKAQRRRSILLSVLGLCVVFSVGYLIYYYSYYEKNDIEYSELSTLVKEDSGGTVEINYTEKQDKPPILKKYETLYNKNRKLIGWLKIEGCDIDYPVMQTSNNEYYLDHNYNQEYDKNGSLFLDKDCDAAFPNDNMIIYGHHMKSGKMFGNLNYYSKESFWEDNKEFTFDTIYETGTYAVMYVFRSKIYSEEEIVFKYYQFIDATSENEFNSNMEEMANMSLYDTGVTASYGDRLITLSTCDSSEEDGRFVVVAKKIK
ncbi:class B sortase [Lacrimispora saccharolytica]|uniref:class B sortase n=1 Tax=Lacrimispora saccharolytica TaxID=84030 RepID=UPI00265CF6D7|nr:class B sortase [Lacrimispora saccharolytica]MCF2656148.1 class B sortase [Lacrimispora saccharolytica]MDY4126732.1 class B sortase [Lachnospiraceae bacterium]